MSEGEERVKLIQRKMPKWKQTTKLPEKLVFRLEFGWRQPAQL